jgi:hypothetical protein
VSALTVLLTAVALPAFVAHMIGKPKHRMGSMYGLLLSWLGVLVVALLPPRHGPDTGELQCPDCGEWVRDEARKCRFCGARLAAG